MNISYDKSILNSEYYSGPFIITEDLIIKFNNITNVKKKWDSEHISPSICNLFISSLNKPDIKLNFGNINFFAGQTIDFISDVKIGDALTASTKLLNVYSKTGRSGKMIFVEWNTIFKNQNAELISNIKESFVRIEDFNDSK